MRGWHAAPSGRSETGEDMISLSRTFPWVRFRSPINRGVRKGQPLREFVYLDEVSLASLLASQKGELTENVTARSEEGFLTEVGGKIATNVPLLPSGEATSRFQTTNSSSLQTVRKANAQSLFRELHNLEFLRRIRPIDVEVPAESVERLIDSHLNKFIYRASDLQRGDLVEFRVKLSASWIFQISTMIAEFSDIFDESPALFIDHVGVYELYQAKNANKVINKLLAGLIPIDGKASEFSIIMHKGCEYIVHNDAVRNLTVERLPLQIVGVTDHLAYWKDIRRILFADDEFTVLCRLSKSGIQSDWNPIKLADIFQEFAPGLAEQIEASTRLAMLQSSEKRVENSAETNLVQLMVALVRYKDILLATLPTPMSEENIEELDELISECKFNAGTAEGQRAAFAQVKLMIESSANHEIDSATDLAAREQVRKAIKLPLFPDPSVKGQGLVDVQPEVSVDKSSRLLDVEVVAIYW